MPPGAVGAAAQDVTPVDALAPASPLPASQRGESAVVGKFFRVAVSNAGQESGFLCGIDAEGDFPGLHPGSLYAILTNPHNDGVFRDIKYVRSRRLLAEERLEAPAPAAPARRRAGLGGLWGGGGGGGTGAAAAAAKATPPAPKRGPVVFRRVEIDQVGELRIFMARREFGTRLVVEEDARRAQGDGVWQTRFALVSSDALSRFQGSWTITAAAAAAAEAEDNGGAEAGGGGGEAHGAASAACPPTTAATTTAGCRCRLEQQVLPRGVPVFFQRVPVLGALLRRVSLGAVERLMRDLQAAAAALAASAPEAAAGGDEAAVHAALDAMRRARLAEGGGGNARGEGERRAAGAHLASHAPPPSGEEDEEEEDDDDEKGAIEDLSARTQTHGPVAVPPRICLRRTEFPS